MPSSLEPEAVDETDSFRKRHAVDGADSGASKRQKIVYYCTFENCVKSYTKKYRLVQHISTHTGEHPYVCEECEKSFMRARQLSSHKLSHSTASLFHCPFPDCNVACNTRQHLNVHQQIHTNPKTYTCTDFPPCSGTFRKKHLLRAHIAEEHTQSPPFPCPYTEEGCHASFTIQSKLTAHIAKRHTNRYFCPDCPASFPLLVDLQRHAHEVHPPRCFTCGAEFTSRDSLVAHLEVHKTTLEERKKFACEWTGCTKRYTKAFALKNHVRTAHEHVKPFVCSVEGCGRAFGFKKVLLRHEMTHTNPAVPRERKKSVVVETDIIDELVGTGYGEGGRRIECTVDGCEFRFSREYDLKRHLASNHKQNRVGLDADGDTDSDVDDFEDTED